MKTVVSSGKSLLFLLVIGLSLLGLLINVAIIYLVFIVFKSDMLIYIYGMLIAIEYGYNLFQMRKDSLNYYQKIRKKIVSLDFKEAVYFSLFTKYLFMSLYILAFCYFGYCLIALILGGIIIIEAIERIYVTRYILNN